MKVKEIKIGTYYYSKDQTVNRIFDNWLINTLIARYKMINKEFDIILKEKRK